MIPPHPAAIVFNCDGTLMGTGHCVRRALDLVFIRRNTLCTDEIRATVTGLALPTMSASMAAILETDEAELSAELLSAIIDQVSVSAVPLPGAVDVLRLTAERLPVAVVSNSPRALLNAALTVGGLATLVPVTIAADEVAAPKPAPDPYLAACLLLGISPRHALAVEDSAVGIASARAAGMSVLSVGRSARLLESDGHVDGLDDPILRHWIGETTRRAAELASS